MLEYFSQINGNLSMIYNIKEAERINTADLIQPWSNFINSSDATPIINLVWASKSTFVQFLVKLNSFKNPIFRKGTLQNPRTGSLRIL